MSGLITPATGAAHARIAGIGAYRPRRVVPNSEIVEAIDSSDEWIRERTGIVERRVGGSTASLSVESGRAALELGLMERPDPEAPGPFRLSAEGALEEVLAGAGLEVDVVEDVPMTWTAPSLGA